MEDIGLHLYRESLEYILNVRITKFRMMIRNIIKGGHLMTLSMNTGWATLYPATLYTATHYHATHYPVLVQ